MSDTRIGQGSRLRAPSQRPAARARWYWAARAAAGWAAVLGVQLAIWLPALHPGGWHAIVFAATAAVALAHVLAMPPWRFRVHRWEVGTGAVYTQSGWFLQERRIAPISRIQTVDTRRGPFEAPFALCNVTVTTASASGPLHIHALDRRLADRLVDELTRRAEASSGDGT